jgi:predicted TIM-barrel fold metal-dependent hydrolase
MNIQFRSSSEPASSAGAKAAIADCDIHPARATATELYPYLAKRWHAHLETYGVHQYQGMMGGPPYPKAQPNASRRDAYPPEGGPQGSSLSFMQQQHLDPNNVALGVLNPLNTGQGIRNHELSAALASAINDWQIDKWTSKDSRLKGSVVVANEDGPTAAAEIRKRAGDKNFVQVLLLSRNVEPLGQRRYWPRRGFPLACMRSVSAAIRSPRRVGRVTTSRRWSATRSASKRRSPASCWRACSSGTQNSR